MVHLASSAQLPVPSAGEQHGLVAGFEETAARLDQLLRTVAALVVGAQRIANQFRCFVPRTQQRAGCETVHVVAAQQTLVALLRRFVLDVDQRQEVDVATARRNAAVSPLRLLRHRAARHQIRAAFLKHLRQTLVVSCAVNKSTLSFINTLSFICIKSL